MTVNLFFTGGFDSTFRLLQLIDNSDISEISLFYIGLNIDNWDSKNFKRNSIETEIITMSKILTVLDNRQKIKQFTIFSTLQNINYWKLFFTDFDFMNWCELDEVVWSEQLEIDYVNLFNWGIVPRLKSQWGSITQLLNELDIQAEICLEKGGRIHYHLSNLPSNCDKKVIDRVFSRYQMPLFEITRQDMILEATNKDWKDILKESWSCWFPKDSLPCGKCFTCQRRPELDSPKLKLNNIGQLVEDIWNWDVEIIHHSDLELSKLDDQYTTDQDKLIMQYLSSQSIEEFQKKKMKVTANIATHPQRFESLLKMLQSIDGQFDETRIYLNQFSHVPEELQHYQTHIGNDITDNGKFFWSGNADEYYFTLDDDLIYPPDYVKVTLPEIRDRIVTYHGRKLIGIGRKYYTEHKLYRFRESLDVDKSIDVPGTGVMAFDTNLFTPQMWKSKNFMMTDLLIGLEAAIYNNEIVCLKRPERWITQIEDCGGVSIWEQFRNRDSYQTSWSDMIQLSKQLDVKNIDKWPKGINPEKKSIWVILQQIDRNRNGHNKLIHIGSGTGKFILHASLCHDFDMYIGVDNLERVTKSNRIKHHFDIKKVLFIEDYKPDKLSIVFLNDVVWSPNLTQKYWNDLPSGCHMMCHNMVNNEFPESKIQILFNGDNKNLVNYYYYIKR